MSSNRTLVWIATIAAAIARMLRLPLIVLGLVSLLLTSAAASTGDLPTTDGRRVALVIGNQNYRHVTPLDNPLNDTREIARILREAEFDVTLGLDLTKVELEETVRKFLRELNDGDIALFYYSGHAIQVGESNFIVPVDAKLSSAYDLEFESLKVSHLLDYMKASSSLQIVMLDACRDNPFEARELYWGQEKYDLGKSRGLRRIPNKLGSLISYATRPGEVAYDGAGPLSPFTSALVDNALNPKLEIRDLMTVVRDEVLKKTNGRQIPWEDSTLVTSFYFVPPAPQPVVAAHHHVEIAATDAAMPLGIPEPVQPEGGEVTATITVAPTKGTLIAADGREIGPGEKLAAAELARLAYRPGGDSGNSVQVIGYSVEDAFGGTASAIATVTIAQAETPPPAATQQDDEDARRKLQDWLLAKADTLPEPAIGVGPVPLYPDAPVSGLASSPVWITVEAVDADLQLLSEDRILVAGDRIPLAGLPTLTVRPQIGTDGRDLGVRFSLPGVDTTSLTIVQAVRPTVDACDRLATQPFDLQAVTEGLLANEIDAEAAAAACDAAIARYPDVARFVFQRGRAAFAQGDLAAARSYFSKANDMGHVRAGQVLGRMYYLGAGTEVNRERAVDLYRKAAEKGDAYALHSLALSELRGEGTPVNEKEGLAKLQRAVEAGHTFSYNQLGYYYLHGEHVEKDIDRAVYYYMRSAERNDIYGYLNMGTLYRDGAGVTQDYEAARNWFLKAHEGGHPAAGTAIGLLYFNGQGVEKDPEEALRWFRASADRGDPWGAYNTAYMIRQSDPSGDRAVEMVRYLALAIATDSSSPAAKNASADFTTVPARVKARATQELLAELGFDPGPADGVLGRKSREALGRFFRETGRTPTTGDAALVDLAKYAWEKNRPRYDLF